jgi:DNA-binding response OmpR family regulator
MLTILVVDDEYSIRKLISAYLTQNGYNVLLAKDGVEALHIMDNNFISLVICDIMMPNLDGYELTEDIRSVDEKLPILMITAKDTLSDKQKGFLLGTDDYMTKPIDLDEMILRVSALLRRAKIYTEHKIEIGNIILDYDSLSFISKEETMELPKKEFYLLYKLLSYPKKIFTRRQLMDEIWGMDSDADERTVDVHIKRLREKLDYYKEFEIITVRGLGYKAERLP